MVRWAQSTTKEYIRDEHKLTSISKLFIPLVIIPQVFFPQTTAKMLPTISERKTNTKQTKKNNNTRFGACLYSVGTQHGNLNPAGWPILFCWPTTQEPVLATANRKQSGELMETIHVNGPEG